MADSVQIRIDVDNKSIKDLKADLKDLKTQFEAARPNTPEWIALGNSVKQADAQIKNISSQFRGVSSAVREARSEKRLFRFVVAELMGSFNGLSNAIDAFTGHLQVGESNTQKFAKSLQESVGNALGLSFALKTMGGTFAAFSGPIGIAVGLFSMFGSVLKNNAEELDKFKKKMVETDESINESLLKMGKITKQQIINLLELQKIALESELALARKAAAPTEHLVTRGVRGQQFTGIEKRGDIEADEKVRTLLDGIAKIDLRIFEVNKEVTAEKEKQTDELRKQRHEAQEMAILFARFFGRASNLGPELGRKPHSIDLGKTQEQGGGPRNAFEALKKINDDKLFDMAQQKTDILVSSMKAGFTEATSYLAEGFRKAFDLGDNLASRFISTFLSSLLNSGIAMLLASIFPGSGLIGASFGGSFSGSPGGGIFGGSSNSGGLSIAQSSMRSGGMIRPSVQVIPIVNNKGLAIQVQMGNNILKNQSY